MKKVIILSTVLFLTGCFNSEETETDSKASIELGKTTFNDNCVFCHGIEGKGLVKDWKKKQSNGKYPAPPLNGTAHSWHHSPKVILQTINDGGVKIGGQMPAFKNKLNDKEKIALIDYIQSLWPTDIQEKYRARFNP
jgi:mono/diheme cytochrome c family protein